MTDTRTRNAWLSRGARFVERLDKMVQAGRLTDEDAKRLKAAANSDELDDAVRDIQLEHARARVDDAIEDGHPSNEGADAVVDRLDKGEDPRFLRGLRHRLHRFSSPS